MKKIIVTGATGQIGSVLTPALRQRYGAENVVAAGHKRKPGGTLLTSGAYITLDVRDRGALDTYVREYNVGTIYHLAALLSASAEKQPQLAWEINMGGLTNVLEVARIYGCAVFHPSSIGAFGPTAPRINTPQESIQRPQTMYGITKVSAELLCDYYFERFGVDTRGVRYPGLISHETSPGGGTTDYAVDIFYAALRQESYTCYLAPGTCLDMMYMPDAVRAAVDLMEADPKRLRFRNAYNITAMSFAPEEIYSAIKKHIPDFIMNYEVDAVRQAVADSWPDRMDDSAARSQWGWQPEYDLASLTADMLARLSAKLSLS